MYCFAPSFCFDVSIFVVMGFGPLQIFYSISLLDQKKIVYFSLEIMVSGPTTVFQNHNSFLLLRECNSPNLAYLYLIKI